MPSTPPPAGSPAGTDVEPRPESGEITFADADFHALGERLCGDAQYNDARLAARRKLLALGKRLIKRVADAEGPKLEARSSLHNPTAFNGMKVRRLWTYAVRAKAEKNRLKKTLGADLAKDLNAAYKNAYLCLAMEAEALEVSLRIHTDAWYDGQNFLKRLKAEGYEPFLEIANRLDGFVLRLHDWKGEWPLADLGAAGLDEYLKYYEPGEHRMVFERRYPAPASARDAACTPEAAGELLAQAERLVPLYRYVAWSKESDFLFGG